jgi:xanthosine utilization system XapX-like protein
MIRAVIAALGLVGMLVCQRALATPEDDLSRILSAFAQAKSVHAEEHLYNGKTVNVDYSAPDRWRVQPAPNVTELILGDDIYMVTNGRATKLPFGGGMIRKMVEKVMVSARSEIKDATDLGMQTLEGQSVHVYSFTHNKVPQTIYVASTRHLDHRAASPTSRRASQQPAPVDCLNPARRAPQTALLDGAS